MRIAVPTAWSAIHGCVVAVDRENKELECPAQAGGILLPPPPVPPSAACSHVSFASHNQRSIGGGPQDCTRDHQDCGDQNPNRLIVEEVASVRPKLHDHDETVQREPDGDEAAPSSEQEDCGRSRDQKGQRRSRGPVIVEDDGLELAVIVQTIRS
jgi:hypothetical protein